MPLKIWARIERWPVAGEFVIARGAKDHVDVIYAEVTDGTLIGRGEGTPVYYKGETAQSCLMQMIELGAPDDSGSAGSSPAERARNGLQTRLPPGATRNALDCALWDLEAQQAGVPLWQLAGLPEPGDAGTAITISLGKPAAMEADARRRSADFALLKLKLSGKGDAARVAAVRRGAPRARLIVDANESWSRRDIAVEAGILAAYGVELIEQPVRAGTDKLLDKVTSPIPLCADESCQDRADLARCEGRYAAINIKLDKTGGLTEAIALRAEAERQGFAIMVGCMLATSLGIAPARLLAAGARWVDLDGALLLAEDREPPVTA